MMLGKVRTIMVSAAFACSSAGCSGKTLQGGSDQPGSADAGSDATPVDTLDVPFGGSVAGKSFALRSVDISYARDQWFLTLRNYEAPCGVLPSQRPDPEQMIVITIGALEPRAGEERIAFGDAHGGTFQVGVFEAGAGEPSIAHVKSGVVRLDSWSDTPESTISGALRLASDAGDEVVGQFEAVVCAPR